MLSFNRCENVKESSSVVASMMMPIRWALAFMLALFSAVRDKSAVVRSRSGERWPDFSVDLCCENHHHSGVSQLSASHLEHQYSRVFTRPRYAAYGSDLSPRGLGSPDPGISSHHLQSARSATPPSFYQSELAAGAPT